MSLDKVMLILRVAFGVFLTGVIWTDTQSMFLSLAVFMLFAYNEISIASRTHIMSRLPSEQDMVDIRKATEDMKELKKHMNWE